MSESNQDNSTSLIIKADTESLIKEAIQTLRQNGVLSKVAQLPEDQLVMVARTCIDPASNDHQGWKDANQLIMEVLPEDETEYLIARNTYRRFAEKIRPIYTTIWRRYAKQQVMARFDDSDLETITNKLGDIGKAMAAEHATQLLLDHSGQMNSKELSSLVASLTNLENLQQREREIQLKTQRLDQQERQLEARLAESEQRVRNAEIKNNELQAKIDKQQKDAEKLASQVEGTPMTQQEIADMVRRTMLGR